MASNLVPHPIGPDSAFLLNNTDETLRGIRIGGRPDNLVATIATDSSGNTVGIAGASGGRYPFSRLLNGPSNWFGSIEFPTVTTADFTNITWENRRSVPWSFYGGRVIAYNTGSAPAANNQQFSVAVAPDGSTTTSSGFTAVTWNGGQTSPSSLFRGTKAGQIEIALSDPFMLNSIPRTDGGSGAIISLLSYGTGVMTYAQPQKGVAFNSPLAYPGDVCLTTQANAANNLLTGNTPGLGTGTSIIVGDLILFTDTTVYTVGQGGDSISQGQFSTTGRDNDVRLACNYLTQNGIANVQYVNRCSPGTTSATFGSDSIEHVKAIRPNIFFYTPESPNDGLPSVAGKIQQQKAYLYYLLKTCQDYGTTLVVCTQAPWWITGYSAADDNATKSFNSWLATFCANAGLLLHDRYSVLSDGGSPAKLQAAYMATGAAGSGNAAHPNDAGYQALRPYATSIIRAIINK